MLITRKFLVYQSDEEFNWRDVTTRKPSDYLVSSIVATCIFDC